MRLPCGIPRGRPDVLPPPPCHQGLADRERPDVPAPADARRRATLSARCSGRSASMAACSRKASCPGSCSPTASCTATSLHLVFNMLALVMFGAQVEYMWGDATLPDVLLRVRGRRGAVPAGRGLVDAVAGRRSLSDPGRLRRHLRPAAGVRHAVPEPARDAAVPADPDEGADPGDPVRRRRTAARPEQLAAWRRAFRPPGRHVVRLAADPLLEREAAVRSQQARPRTADARRCVCKAKAARDSAPFCFTDRAGLLRPRRRRHAPASLPATPRRAARPGPASPCRPCSRRLRRTPAG